MLKKIGSITVIIIASILIFMCLNASAQSTSQTMSLRPGYNFVSMTIGTSQNATQLIAQNPYIESIMAYSALDKIYLTTASGTLTEIVPGRGYIIKSKLFSDNSLTISGTELRAVGDINLLTGYNLVGFSKMPQSITFSQFMNQCIHIRGTYKWSPAAGSFISVVRDAGGSPALLDGVDPSFRAGESYFMYADQPIKINYDGGAIIAN